MAGSRVVLKPNNSDVEDAIKPELHDDFSWVSRLIGHRVAKVEDLFNYMRCSIADLPDPLLLKDMDKASAIIADAIKNNRRVYCQADWDADGCGCAAVVHMAFTKMGYRNFKVNFPDRNKENHGLNQRAVEAAAAMNADVILTVDNGSSSAEAIALAKAKNMKTVITDHHEVPAGDLGADAVVNPKRPDDELGDESLCGAGIAYLLMEQVRRDLGLDSVDLSDCLQVTAISTMADVVPLNHNNRKLVRCGVDLIRSRPIPFIAAVCNLLGIKHENLTGSDLAWKIAPLLNAAGRIEKASYAYHALLSEGERAKAAAEYLQACNTKRRNMMTEAMNLKPGWSFEGERVKLGADATWHPGVVGLIAGNMARDTGKVCGCAALDHDGNWRFSFRSPASGAGIAEAMIKLRAAGVIESGGGHDAAGGCVVKKDRLPIFAKLIDETMVDVDAAIEVDGEISPSWWTVEGINYVHELLEPIGNGNAPVQMLWKGKADSVMPLKDKHIKMVVGGTELVWFNVPDRDAILGNIRSRNIEVVYAPRINEFGGRESVQGIVQYVGMST